MSKKYNVNNGNNVNETNPVNPEVTEEVKAAEAAPQTEDNEQADPAPEVVEKKEGIFKRARNKASKIWNEGFETPPFKDVVKKVVTTVGVAAGGAAAAVLVIAKINADNGECNDQYMLEESSGRPEPDFETTFEENVPEDEE